MWDFFISHYFIHMKKHLLRRYLHDLKPLNISSEGSKLTPILRGHLEDFFRDVLGLENTTPFFHRKGIYWHGRVVSRHFGFNDFVKNAWFKSQVPSIPTESMYYISLQSTINLHLSIPVWWIDPLGFKAVWPFFCRCQDVVVPFEYIRNFMIEVQFTGIQ